MPPAKRIYDTSASLFSIPIRIDKLSEAEKIFLMQYYDLKLRSYTGKIGKAGQALAIAERRFKGTHNYVLILPLLHVTVGQPINIYVLPKWMQTSEQLAILSDVCLLHFGFPFQAMMLEKKSSEICEREIQN